MGGSTRGGGRGRRPREGGDKHPETISFGSLLLLVECPCVATGNTSHNKLYVNFHIITINITIINIKTHISIYLYLK